MAFSNYAKGYVLNELVVGSQKLQLHTGVPGGDGDANLADEGLEGKLAVTMGAVSVDLTSSNTTVVRFGPATSQVVATHASLWDPTETNCTYTGQLSQAQNIQPGGYAEFGVGDLVVDNI